jgi:hypothetical protein
VSQSIRGRSSPNVYIGKKYFVTPIAVPMSQDSEKLDYAIKVK